MANASRPNREVIIQDIITLKLKKGWSKFNIVKHLQAKYGFGNTASYLAYKEASVQIGELYNEMNNQVTIESIMLMEQMVQDALEKRNSKLALEIIKELNKCHHMYLTKVELEVKEPIILNIIKSK